MCLQPIYLQIVRELEDELINYPINANCTTDEFHFRVFRIFEDEMIRVETSKLRTSNTAGHLEAR